MTLVISGPPPVADYSSAQIEAAALAGYPVAGVMRYAAAGRTDVNITAAEYANLDAAGIPVGITCEQSATFLLGGRTAGSNIARGALAVTRAAGIPDGVTGYAADFQVASGQMPALLGTLTGCADVTGWGDVGVYADYDAIEWLLQNSPIRWFWQTSSWSAGRIHPAAAMIQDRYWTPDAPITIGGGPVDLSTVRGDWRPRNLEEFNMAAVDDIKAAIAAATGEILKDVGARLDSIVGPHPAGMTGPASLCSIQNTGTVTYGRQDPKTGLPVDGTHTGIGDLARMLRALPGTVATGVTAAVVAAIPAAQVDTAALEASIRTVVDAALAAATIHVTPGGNA